MEFLPAELPEPINPRRRQSCGNHYAEPPADRCRRIRRESVSLL